MTRAGEPVAGLSESPNQGALGLDAGSDVATARPKAQKEARNAPRARESALSQSTTEPATPTLPALAPLPTSGDDYVRVVTNPPTDSGRPPKKPGDGDVIDRDLGPDDETLDRELQQLIDQGLPTDPIDQPVDAPTTDEPVSDEPTDLVEEPGVPPTEPETGEEPTDPAPGPDIEPDPSTEPQPEPAPDPEAGDEPQADPVPAPPAADEPQAEAPVAPASTSPSPAPCAPQQPDDSLPA